MLRTKRATGKPAEYYTHTDLYRALELGYEIVLAQDGQPNALIYERGGLVSAEKIFHGFIGKLFAIRADPEQPKATRDAVKIPLTAFWGWLGQRTSHSQFAATGVRRGPIKLVGELTDFRDTASGTIYRSCDDSNAFFGECPRFAPFITAAARNVVSKLAEPLVKNGRLRRVYTDSFIVEGDELPAVPMADVDGVPQLGRWKLEGRGHCSIKNAGRLTKSWKK